jgi:type IV secretory pathway VirB2 component (pilin)
MLFGTENIVPHLIMTSLLAAMIAIALFTIIAMDYPFTGNISIQSDVFTNMLSSLTGS